MKNSCSKSYDNLESSKIFSKGKGSRRRGNVLLPVAENFEDKFHLCTKANLNPFQNTSFFYINPRYLFCLLKV